MQNILIVFSGKAQSGKCFGRNTLVLMYDGSIKKVQDVEAGELLMGDDSTPRKVLSLASGYENLYEIQQSRGVSYIVNESHILSLKWTHCDDSHKTGELEDIELKKYLKLNKIQKRHLYGYSNSVEFKYHETTIPPYFLGLWLGDGHSANQGITSAHEEVKTYLETYAKDLNLKIRTVHTPNVSKSYFITTGNIKNILLTNLQKLNLINNKHIPEIYKINNRENRLQLLAGLLDTDGYYDGHGQFEISQKNETLARDIVFLARSLGFYASIKRVRKECVNNGVWGTYFRVAIFGNIDCIPTKIKRKIAKKRIKNVNSCLSTIGVSFCGPGRYYGFVLDGNHRFLLSDFTVVHNTTCAQMLKTSIDEQFENDNPNINSKSLGNSRVQIYSFALALKDIAEKYFGWAGDKGIYVQPIGGVDGEDVIIPDRGRQLLINIGQHMRAIRPTVWVDYVINKIKKDASTGSDKVFIIDDMRFMNELVLAKTLDACISIRLHRHSQLEINDTSETDLDDAEFDYYIENNGDMNALKLELSGLFEKIKLKY